MKNSHIRKRFALFLSLMALILAFMAFWRGRSAGGAKRYYLDEYLVSLLAPSPADLAFMLKDLPAERVKVQGEGLYLYLSSRQLQSWTAFLDERASDLEKAALEEGLQLQMEEHPGTIRLWCHEEDSFEKVMQTIREGEFTAGLRQILHGTEKWYVMVEVYNAKTGRLVCAGDNLKGVYMSTEDWLNSYDPENEAESMDK